MTRTIIAIACAALVSLALSLKIGSAIAADEPVAKSETLRSPESFADIQEPAERSVAMFNEMGKVLTHPRCVACHPKGDTPLQGMSLQAHQPPVVRGVGGMGAAGMRCSTCHGEENVAFDTAEGSIPGHPGWRLAPASMAWEGKSLAQICEQLKDPERSHMTLEELQKHNAEDGLVGWGWHPGEGRIPVPGTQAIFGELTQAWIDTGAVCPEG
ncbi:Isoquinoline 1-oxidoreductase subunit [Marinobacter bohaiensis]|uniref:Isoquinoline 1-oxidoreductase subunit n=1 Tax=Marinobacter bohaiensis TaxID=2201898 RepID=UPI000DAEADE3|nr:Isoquinoline 1-oxidoreductase subunit [Marinobacter bohaiensis]